MISAAFATVFIAGLLLSYLLTPVMIRIAYVLELLDHPDERKRHQKPMPYTGGLVIFLSFWILVAAGFFLADLFKHELFAVFSLPPLFDNVIPWIPKIAGVFTGSLVLVIMGLLDDRFNLNPFIKLAVQSGVAILLLNIGLQVNLFQTFGFFGYVVTFFWIVLLMNAFNFIDSIDGHCAGIAIISAFIFFSITQLIDQAAVGLLIAAFAGSLVGFFPYNFKPAKVFLGDNGSLFIGYMMSVITLLCRYNHTLGNEITPLIPILMFGVPIYDTLSVIIVRIIRGIKPWTGDRNHFAHRLVKMGMGERNAALASYFIAFTLGLVALLSTQITTPLGNFLLMAIFISIISIIALLEYYSALRIRISEQLAQHHKRRSTDIQAVEDRRRRR